LLLLPILLLLSGNNVSVKSPVISEKDSFICQSAQKVGTVS